MKKKLYVLLAAALLASSLAGCSSNNSSPAESSSDSFNTARQSASPMSPQYAKAISEEIAYEMEAGTSAGGAEDSGLGGNSAAIQDTAASSRKIITNVNLQMETKTFDSGVDSIAAIVEQFGGYVQSSYVEGKSLYYERGTRSARFTLRIPADRLGEMLSAFSSTFNITSTDQSGNDVTDQYFDIEARLNSLRVQEQQLLKMLEDSKELKYLIEVQKELSSVRYQIETLISSLNRMDSYVSMSTVNIYLSEVVEYEQLRNEPATFSAELRMTIRESADMFLRFCRNLLLAVIVFFPYLLILLALLFIILSIRRKRKRAVQKKLQQLQNDLHIHPLPVKKNEPQEAPAPEPPTNDNE